MNEDDQAKLLSTTDASVWADVFAKTYPGVHDQGVMLGWFASAIETGRTAGHAVPPLLPSEAVTGFVAWLTTRPKTICAGGKNTAYDIHEALALYLEGQALAPPREDFVERLRSMP